jgi:phosphopantetheinyl transferase (holo-ACP synthase)
MATTSLTWRFETESPLRFIGCGIDSEKVDRFDGLVARAGSPMPFVFSHREVRHNRGLPHPAEGFCVGFCLKEAARKALPGPLNFSECEVFGEPGPLGATNRIHMRLSDALKREFCIEKAVCTAEVSGLDPNEIVAAVYFFSRGDQ